jgi:methionyl-tRNA formyltransferase
VSLGQGRYLVAGSKPWNRRIFDEVIVNYPGEWRYAGSVDELSVDSVTEFDPSYVFFMHWSWKVPPELTENYDCVAFHMTDLPYGRGGSPLQNLILRGHQFTKLCALKMSETFDAGPVYLREDLALDGSAEEIYKRANDLSAQMIQRIVSDDIEPVPQSGEPVIFRRRKPHESELSGLQGLEATYDFIRMLDAEGYPNAFIESDGLRFEFSGASIGNGSVKAEVKITQSSASVSE